MMAAVAEKSCGAIVATDISIKIRRSCIIITKYYNSSSPVLHSLESVIQAFSHASTNLGARSNTQNKEFIGLQPLLNLIQLLI